MWLPAFMNCDEMWRPGWDGSTQQCRNDTKTIHCCALCILISALSFLFFFAFIQTVDFKPFRGHGWFCFFLYFSVVNTWKTIFQDRVRQQLRLLPRSFLTEHGERGVSLHRSHTMRKPTLFSITTYKWCSFTVFAGSFIVVLWWMVKYCLFINNEIHSEDCLHCAELSKS